MHIRETGGCLEREREGFFSQLVSAAAVFKGNFEINRFLEDEQDAKDEFLKDYDKILLHVSRVIWSF